MDNAGFGVVILLVVLVVFAVMLWGLIDAARRPDAAFTAAGSSKVMWILLIVFFGVFAAVPYLIAIRPKLARATTGGAETALGT